MHAARFSLVSLVLAALTASIAPAAAQAMTVDEFRRELVGVPLCGTPETGPLAGKALCTVHLPDGTAILAGAGLVVYGLWEASGGQISRRSALRQGFASATPMTWPARPPAAAASDW